MSWFFNMCDSNMHGKRIKIYFLFFYLILVEISSQVTSVWFKNNQQAANECYNLLF
jgi:hypothetical protein